MNKTPSPRSKRSARLEKTEFEQDNESQDASGTQPGHPGREMDSHSTQRLKAGEADEELVLTFLTYYHALEQAMMRAGFTRAGRSPGSSQPDWVRFARHIEGQFDPDSSPVLQGAVAYLLWEKDNLAWRNDRMESAHPWETASPYDDIIWISELLQRTRNQVAYDLNFPGAPKLDTAQVLAALMIVEEWGQLDEEVGKFMNSRETH